MEIRKFPNPWFSDIPGKRICTHIIFSHTFKLESSSPLGKERFYEAAPKPLQLYINTTWILGQLALKHQPKIWLVRRWKWALICPFCGTLRFSGVVRVGDCRRELQRAPGFWTSSSLVQTRATWLLPTVQSFIFWVFE